MKANIVLLPGDGIGPEVVSAAVRVLEAIGQRFGHTFKFTEHLIGGCAIDQTGNPLPEATLEACRTADAVLLGAVGGPKWDDPRASVRPEQGLLGLRRGLGVFANLRPVRVHPALIEASPLKPDRLQGVDLIVVRELTGGLYFGQPKKREWVNGQYHAVDTLEYSETEIERIVDLAFRLACQRRKKVSSVDKANVLESSRLWREVTNRVAQRYPDILLEHVLVDTAAMRLISAPHSFDVVVTENMFGDILTDEAAVLVGSMGMLPSASLNGKHGGLYEPIHGSAPDIAGQGIANPIGTILSAAMLLRYSLGLEQEARAIERAVDRAIEEGCRTRDLGGSLSTTAMTDAVIERLG
ncbi:3-isopropylmalate dehydrogenase [Thermanaerothrix daxensis]|uniref:3-isopropylmalate dehydrogenase n=1 Tax=Thermanaerothrix daxensis TaxID=869279 RepID=A0A0P6Y2A1_9CHLR|nr:3-isopropylmalate dehydrogenase [Thermanaerothrix daxensis]KPL83160.1 3-isopropylmalate dehydrogenase [Thermanaerothrix daxensis]